MTTSLKTKSAETLCLDQTRFAGKFRAGARSGEGGYTLVALLALMTLLAIAALAAVPNVRHQALRERETEAIFRGEEVAEAIRLYVKYSPNNQLPNSMEQLLEGVQQPGRIKKIQVLRPSAARDPLSSSGEWRLIRITDKAMLDFQRAVTVYNGGKPPLTRDPLIQRHATLPPMAGLLDLGPAEEAPCDEDNSENPKGFFIGVASRNSCASIITYYGIQRHDQWIFTPVFR